MYFWNTKALSEDIKKRKLSDKDWKSYYLAGCILVTLLTYMIELNPREYTTSILIEAILNIGIIIFGVNITFVTHQADDNNVAGYISKMVALSFPLIIKIFTLAVVMGVLIGIAIAMGLSLVFFQAWMVVILSLSVQLLFFWRLNVHLHSINI